MWIIPEQAYFLPVSQINTSVYLNPLSDISGQIISNIVEPPKMAPLNTHHTSYSYIKQNENYNRDYSPEPCIMGIRHTCFIYTIIFINQKYIRGSFALCNTPPVVLIFYFSRIWKSFDQKPCSAFVKTSHFKILKRNIFAYTIIISSM